MFCATPSDQRPADASPKLVNATDLERELAIVRNAGANNRAGVFGPGSLMWNIDKEAAIFLGAGRALLLQLAHPCWGGRPPTASSVPGCEVVTTQPREPSG